MAPQTVYTEAPAVGIPGGIVDTAILRDIISRVLSTQKLSSVLIDATAANGTYTITINGVEVASFAASSSTQAQVRDGLLADFASSSAPVSAAAGGTGEILIEGTDEDADYTISVGGPVGDITLSTLVPYGQAVPFGVGVVGDDRAAVSASQCRLPRLAVDITGGRFLGASMADTTLETRAGAEGGYGDGSAVPIVHRGRVYVLSESIVAEGAAVYCRFASGSGGTQLGAFRGDADSTTAALVPNAKFGKATTAINQLTYIELL
jgi:hypothetical protein